MHLNQKFRLLGAVCAGLSFLLAPCGVLAADAVNPRNEQGTQRPDYLPAKPKVPFQLPPVEPSAGTSSAEESAAKVKFDHAIFHGNTVFSAKELEAIAFPYVGRTLGASEFEELRQQLTRRYVDSGYVNSGVLLEKVSADGVAVFNVIEGRLSEIRLRGMARLNENYVARRLVKDTDGPLNIITLRERYQLLLSDPLFQRMNARLMPDTQLGQAILDVDVERARPYQLTASVNNYRPPSIGSDAVNLGGLVRNLSGQGDLLEANIQSSTSLASVDRGSLAWQMPLGYHGTQFSLAIDQGHSSVIEEPMQVLDIQSTLDSRDIGLSQSLIETLANKLTIGINRVIRENRTTLLGNPFSFVAGEPNGVSQESLWQFWQEFTHRSETQVMALRATYISGENNIQEVAGLPPTDKIQREYHIWLVQAQYARQVLENGAQIILRGTSQGTDDRLLPLDGLSIGGVNTVRGYRENQLVRDNGDIFNLEFEFPLVRSAAPKGFKLTTIPFYDIGRGRNTHDSAITISSFGLANRFQWQGFNLDIAVAERLVYPKSIISSGATLQDKGVHVQLSYVY